MNLTVLVFSDDLFILPLYSHLKHACVRAAHSPVCRFDVHYIKNMMSRDIWLHNGCLKISPSRHVKLEAWDAIDADDVILSLDNSPEEIGSGLKLALSRCR